MSDRAEGPRDEGAKAWDSDAEAADGSAKGTDGGAKCSASFAHIYLKSVE